MSLLTRVARRLAPAPASESADQEQASVDQFLAEHYPGDGWKALSPDVKKIWVQFYPIIVGEGVRSIAYVGANVGGTALVLNAAFPGLRLFLIEPVPHVFQTLLENVGSQQNIHCIPMAAGAEEGDCEMYVDSYAMASSLLPYTPAARKEYPFLGKQDRVTVPVKPLDTILQDCAGDQEIDMVVMDVQGYEDAVIRGAERTLSRCKVVMSELSLEGLYAGSSLFDSVYQALVKRGFRLRHLLNPHVGKSCQIIQIDGVFVRDSLPG